MTSASDSHTFGFDGSLWTASRHSRALAAVSGFGLKLRRTHPQVVFVMSPAEERRARSAYEIAPSSSDSATPATSASAAAVLGFSRTGEIVWDQRRAPE